MSAFSLEALLDSRRGEDLDLWARTINPQFVRVLRTIGFDRTWARAEGAYLSKLRRLLHMAQKSRGVANPAPRPTGAIAVP